MSREEADNLKQLLIRFGMMTTVSDLDKEEFLSVCHKDKKADGSKIKVVLLKKIGTAYMDTNVTDDELWTAFQTIVEK